MGANSKIEWTDHTLNFWVGCTKVSPACDHCYAESWAKRSGHPELWTGERRRTKTWHDLVKWNREAAAKGIRYRVFSNSLSDFFDNQVPESWRDDAWHYIYATPNLDYLLLTKRPQNIKKMLPSPKIGCAEWGDGWPNVWLGTTAEDQPHFAARWRHLSAVPAVVRFISYEPALGPLRLYQTPDVPLAHPLPDWIICGGESGGNARYMEHKWAADMLNDCAHLGVAFFMKQMTKKAPIPADLMVRQFPAKSVRREGMK